MYDKNQTVRLTTSKGDVTILVFNETMPITGGNFVELVEKGFYDGVTFHRIIPGFVIQGGDPDGNGTGGPGYFIEDEFDKGNTNLTGTLSMANAGPNTGGSQFFINLEDNTPLDGKHPVFGKVTEGIKIVEEIAKVNTDHFDMPVEPVVIIKAEIIN